MFTGLIECVGVVSSVSQRPDGIALIEVSSVPFSGELSLGDSVAVSGACLTVTAKGKNSFAAEMMEETASATRLGGLKMGDRVNLERAMSAGARFDGHIVSGHVDGVAELLKIDVSRGLRKYWFSVLPELMKGIPRKGSVAVDGVSLTVIDSVRSSFSVGLIPSTLDKTTFGALSPGDRVNVEIDTIARYVMHCLGFLKGEKIDDPESITWDKLTEYGWG